MPPRSKKPNSPSNVDNGAKASKRVLGWTWHEKDLQYLGTLSIKDVSDKEPTYYNILMRVYQHITPKAEEYKVAKVGGETYTVHLRAEGHTCNCPAGRKPGRKQTHCRHVAALLNLKERGRIA